MLKQKCRNVEFFEMKQNADMHLDTVITIKMANKIAKAAHIKWKWKLQNFNFIVNKAFPYVLFKKILYNCMHPRGALLHLLHFCSVFCTMLFEFSFFFFSLLNLTLGDGEHLANVFFITMHAFGLHTLFKNEICLECNVWCQMLSIEIN